jgi:MoxR-like ATPase
MFTDEDNEKKQHMSDRNLIQKLHQTAQELSNHFLDKEEVIRLLMISVLAGEHMVIIGPPGTAKSAMIRMFSKLIDAKYFEYLLTRFTEPNELFGPVDIKAFREGVYTRKVDGMLPQAEIVFLDEIFKSNSAILNSLLTLINERRYANGANVVDVPLISVFAASNEVPNDEALEAIFDRFLLRVLSDNLDSFHFHQLLAKGLLNEMEKLTGSNQLAESRLRKQDLVALRAAFIERMKFADEFLSAYKGIIFQIRSEGISLSDRRVIKFLKLFAASALFDGREQANESDFFILKHVWNNLDQKEILEEIVGPVVERFYRDHPEERRFGGPRASLEELAQELRLIRTLLTSNEPLSDIQLFSQLENLNAIKGALQSIATPDANRLIQQVDQLLQHFFASSKFAS